MLMDQDEARALARLQKFDFRHESTLKPREWLISCDESGTGGACYYGFGALVMDHNRRGDFQDDIRSLRNAHSYGDEIKWHKVKYARLPFYKDLVDYFFDTSRLAFHCIVIRRAIIDKSMHNGDWDLARRKHFAMFVSNKICRQLACRPDMQQLFRLWVDPIASREKKADEILHIIGNRLVALKVGAAADHRNGPLLGVHVHDSKKTAQIQLCDVLLGAVMDAWQEDATERGKLELKAHIAKRLNRVGAGPAALWPDLKADTAPSARKFNIWYFKPPKKNREVETRTTPWDRKR